MNNLGDVSRFIYTEEDLKHLSIKKRDNKEEVLNQINNIIENNGEFDSEKFNDLISKIKEENK